MRLLFTFTGTVEDVVHHAGDNARQRHGAEGYFCMLSSLAELSVGLPPHLMDTGRLSRVRHL